MSAIKGTKLTAKVNTITPAIAKKMLSTTKKNRRLSRSRVLRYAQAMELGEWTLAQPLMVNCDGTLIDGQHRLNAVMHCGKAQAFVVIEGFDRDRTFGKIDDTATRRLSHWLDIQGEPVPDILATVIKWSARLDAGLVPCAGGGSFMQTGVEGLEYLSSHPECREAVLAPGTVTPNCSRSILAFVYMLCARKDATLAKTFMIDLTMADDKIEGDPIYLLRERLKSNRYRKHKLPRVEVMALVIKAWNAVRSGQKLYNLRWRSTGPGAEPFPEVQ